MEENAVVSKIEPINEQLLPIVRQGLNQEGANERTKVGIEISSQQIEKRQATLDWFYSSYRIPNNLHVCGELVANENQPLSEDEKTEIEKNLKILTNANKTVAELHHPDDFNLYY
jgi:hypothetical protein